MNITQQGSVSTALSPTGVATITFFHPNHNSLPSRLLQGLVEHLQSAGADPAVRVIVLRSAEHKTFCAGASFDELAAIQDFETGKAFFAGFGNVINAMRRCPKIIVGRVHGKAVGGGVGLAAATDYCMASMYASIRLSELAVGFGPFVIGPAVERKVGAAAFSQTMSWPSGVMIAGEKPFSGSIRFGGATGRLHRPFLPKFVFVQPRSAQRTQNRILARRRTLGRAAGRARCHQRTTGVVRVYEAGHRRLQNKIMALQFAGGAE